MQVCHLTYLSLRSLSLDVNAWLRASFLASISLDANVDIELVGHWCKCVCLCPLSFSSFVLESITFRLTFGISLRGS